MTLSELRTLFWKESEQTLGEFLAGRRLVDKLPLNIVDAGLISALFPGAPIIVSLRDPRDVCLSCFMQQFSLNEAMVHFTDIASTVELYAEVMSLRKALRNLLPATGYHEYHSEELVRNSEHVLRQIFSFAGVEWDDSVLRFHKSTPGRYINTPSYSSINQPLTSQTIGRWRCYQSNFSPYLSRLTRFVELLGYDNADSVSRT